MKHGVIYCRVSSKEQIEGTSLESQELACREFARTKGIAIHQVFVGRGESAKFADRPELLELLEYCRKHQGEVSTLLVWKLDRLARNVSDHFNIKATLLKYGINVLSVTEPIDANPEGKLLETILAGFAQFDNDVRAMRTVQGMRRKLQEGILPWMPPLGYRSTRLQREKKLKPDEPDEPLFGLLQRAWKKFATGAYSKAEIKQLMTNWGIVTRKGDSISHQSLDNLFRNPYYAGILIDSWSHDEYEGKHQPMVTKEEFARVQQLLSKRNQMVPHRRIRTEFPLRGSVRCPDCKKYMTSSFSRGRHGGRYPYYRCLRTPCNNGKSYRAATIHDEFKTLLKRTIPTPHAMTALRQAIIDAATERILERSKVADQKKEQAARVSNNIKRLIRMRVQDQITDEEFALEKATLAEKRARLESSATYHNASVKEIERDLDRILQPLANLPHTWDSLTVFQKQGLQRLVLPVGYVAGEIGTPELGLLFTIFWQGEPRLSNAVAPTGENWNRLIQEIRAFVNIFDHALDEHQAT